MTLRPILKAMPKYRRRQRTSAHSSCSSSPASTPTSPDALSLSSSSSSLPSPCSFTSSRGFQGLQLSSLPSPRLSSPLVTSPHVHFPPTPAISSTQLTHSASTYDRAPIEVSPNSCELPERGGRVYDVCSSDSVCHASRTGGTCVAPKDSYFQPEACEACETESVDDPAHEHELSLVLSPSLSSPSPSPSPSYFSPNYIASSYTSSSQFLQVPSLTHDLSSASSSSCSESEDSDLSPNTCGDGYSFTHPYINSNSPLVSSPTSSNHSSSSYPSSPYPLSGLSAAPDSEEFAYALSFLPSSPHPPPKGSPHPNKHARKRHSKRTLRGDQTPNLSPRSRVGTNEWDEDKLDGCLGGF